MMRSRRFLGDGAGPGRLRFALGLAPLILAVTLTNPSVVASSFKLPIFPLERPAPPILERIPEDHDVSAVTLTVDGSRAATASVDLENPYKAKSTIRLYSRDDLEPATREFHGEVRDMLFAPEGEVLFLLLHIAAKKRPGDVFLVRIDLATWKSRRELRLPPSAQGLTYWPSGDAMLIVCADEIRSVLSPGYRSGPLYRLLGVNTSAAATDGGRILVGRADGLVVIDLYDPQGEQQMPVRARIDSFEPVRQVAVNRDASLALARLEAGGIVEVDLRTPAFGDEIGRGILPLRPWPRSAAEPRRAIEAAPTVASDPPDEPAAAPTVAPTVAGDLPDAPAAASIAPQAAATPPVSVEAPSRSQATPQATIPVNAQVLGTITGAGEGDVSAVVFFGPDNIVHEAQRVTPDEHGRWSAEGLEPGRYRIQLVAAGGRVLTVDPAFRVVEIARDQKAVSAPFRVLDAP